MEIWQNKITNTFTIPTNKKAGEVYLVQVDLEASRFEEIVDEVSTFTTVLDFYDAEREGLFEIRYIS